ncbi:hypothetical protein GCM10010495_38150 [Kitasatospora herbaricolor]|nr:hypothetical protein GCM10010495_38150 [Kitasatospora herbaricolor]
MRQRRADDGPNVPTPSPGHRSGPRGTGWEDHQFAEEAREKAGEGVSGPTDSALPGRDEEITVLTRAVHGLPRGTWRGRRDRRRPGLRQEGGERRAGGGRRAGG